MVNLKTDKLSKNLGKIIKYSTYYALLKKIKGANKEVKKTA